MKHIIRLLNLPFIPVRAHRGLALSAIAVSLALFASGSGAEKAFSVGFLNPTVEEVESASPFYDLMQRILRAAAQNLDIDLQIIYGKNSAIRMRRAGLELMETAAPDYFLTGYYMDATNSHLDYTQKNPVRIFIVTASPPGGVVGKVGTPRGTYKNWIGQLTPDDEQFGYIEADYLINLARQHGLADDQKRVNIIAFGGFNEDATSDTRINGLKRRIAEHNDATLLETTLVGWSRDLAYRYTLELLKKNPSIHAIWSTNDDMAIGCIKAAEEAGRKPGKDILIGGIDLDKQAIDNLESGKQAVSVGGQFMEAAWSLIMLYDYHHGIDFGAANNHVFHSKAHVVTKQNVADFKKYFLPVNWNNVDFRRFTKKHNPAIKEYDFSLEAFQKILMEQNG